MSTSIDDQKHDQERVLYGFWLSPYMALVAQFLKESNIGFRYERVSAFLGSTHTNEHKAKNPLAKIPSLRDSNGLFVSESQAICRYISRAYPQSREFYPCDDPVKCASVDSKNDFITFHISGPFFNWFVAGAYFPQAFQMKTQNESHIFSMWSAFMIKGALRRLIISSEMEPFLVGSAPYLPDFHLFHVLELGKTFSKLFKMPMLNLAEGDEALQRFYGAMSSRPSTKEILEAQANEFPITKREIFEEFGKAYEELLKGGKGALQAMFGHEV